MSREATQWKPGQSGNPKGRPRREYDLGEALEKLLKSNVPAQFNPTGKAMTWAELTAMTLVHEAVAEKNPYFMKILADKTHRPPDDRPESVVIRITPEDRELLS